MVQRRWDLWHLDQSDLVPGTRKIVVRGRSGKRSKIDPGKSAMECGHEDT